jgi:PAS domain S-box-containing protein
MFAQLRTLVTRIWMASILRQLILGIALVHAVLMTVFVVDLVERQSAFLHAQSVYQAEGLAKTLASSSISWVLASDIAGLDEVLQSQSSFPELRYAMVINPQGKVLAHTDKSKINLYFSDDISRSLLKQTAQTQTLLANDMLLDVAHPILIDEKLIGWARVGVGQEKIAAGLEKISNNGIIYTLLAILIGSLFAFFMARNLTGGLRHLINIAEGNRQGRRELRANMQRQDEIGLLAQDFDQMLDALLQQEKDLREREENLSVTLHSIGDAVITTDIGGKVLNMNPVAEQLTGWTMHDAHDQALDSVFHIINSQTRLRVTNPVQHVLASGNIVGLANHTSLISRQGREHQIADSAAPIRNRLGQITGVVLVFHDVTEQYQQQALIAAHDAELKRIFDVLPAPIARVDQDGRYLFVSAAYEQWFGKRPEEVIGRTQRESVSAEHYAKVAPYFARALAGEQVNFETAINTPSGEIKYAQISALPDYDSTAVVCGFFVIVADITARKQAEAAIAESRNLLMTIIDTLPLRVFWKDRDLRYLGCNRAFIKDTGMTDIVDIIGKDDFQIGWAAQAEHYRADDRAVMESGMPKLFYDEQLEASNGSISWIRTSKVPLTNHRHEIIGLLGIYEDITGHKQAEQATQVLRDQLIQATKMEAVGHLTAGIAHDFNNILGAILGYTELSKHVIASGSPQDVERYLDEILTASLRAKELISQMLTFSRLSNDTAADAPITLLATVVKEVSSLLRSSIPSTIEFNYQIADPELRARIQPVNLHQIILNLSLNARDAIGEYGRIDITLSRNTANRLVCDSCQYPFEGEFVKLTVRDTGSGIDEQIKNNIFNPFFTTKGVGKGTGMGLSVVHGLVHALGGHILVESTPGKGTAFSILLPLTENQAANTPSPSLSDNSNSTLRGLRIMVVDDELSMTAMLHEFLSMYGAEVTAFNSPVTAWNVFEAQPQQVDLVITDETMPGLSGMHLAERMLKLRADLPIILCTGYSDHATPELAEQAGLAGFFYKPLKINDLLQKIHTII